MVKSVQGVAASTAANITNASSDRVEAVNALVVILGSTLQAVLIGLNKTAEIVTEVPRPSLLILKIATNGVNGAIQNLTSLVNQKSSAISNSSTTTAALSANVPIIESTLDIIVTSLSNQWDIICKIMTRLNLLSQI